MWVYVTEKGVLFDMNMEINYVWWCCMRLGCTKVCYTLLRKSLSGGLVLKREVATKRSAAGIFSETGQALKQNW